MMQNIINTQISIIIPSRNIDFLLEHSIEKIRQLYPNVKIILVLDDDSKKHIYSNDKNISVIKSDNYNMSAKRNAGVDLANTEYIAFIDSDAYPKEN